MQDQFGRTIEYLRLSVTDRCNLRCRYCMPEEGVTDLAHGDVLRYEEMLRVVAAACRLGIRKVRVTGGEPLVRRGIVSFIGQLAALPEKPEITLTTNGMLLAEHAEALKAAGLSRVNVSLDTMRPERFKELTLRSGLDQVLAGIQAAESVGLLPIKLNVIPFVDFNTDEIVDFARLTLEHPWDVRFIEFMPISSDLDYASRDGLSMADVEARLRTLGELEALPYQRTSGPAHMYRLPGAKGRIGLIPSVSGHFCGDCNRLRVMADGRVRGCLFDNQETDLKLILRDGGDDQALEELLLAAACAKPEKHQIHDKDFTTPNRRMHGIGG
ncbi:MAG: GTP 3',8-cyclase MoaA [Desulfuromonadales bacterium]|nr:GTP 3',8-cyclase MoaA [Desulfuromonadales bacterium]